MVSQIHYISGCKLLQRYHIRMIFSRFPVAQLSRAININPNVGDTCATRQGYFCLKTLAVPQNIHLSVKSQFCYLFIVSISYHYKKIFVNKYSPYTYADIAVCDFIEKYLLWINNGKLDIRQYKSKYESNISIILKQFFIWDTLYIFLKNWHDLNTIIQ